MFRKRPSWYRVASKALLFTVVIYKVAGMFMKSSEKKLTPKKKKSKKTDTIKNIRRALKALRT